jgi:hypothetical protein
MHVNTVTTDTRRHRESELAMFYEHVDFFHNDHYEQNTSHTLCSFSLHCVPCTYRPTHIYVNSQRLQQLKRLKYGSVFTGTQLLLKFAISQFSLLSVFATSQFSVFRSFATSQSSLLLNFRCFSVFVTSHSSLNLIFAVSQFSLLLSLHSFSVLATSQFSLLLGFRCLSFRCFSGFTAPRFSFSVFTTSQFSLLLRFHRTSVFHAS